MVTPLDLAFNGRRISMEKITSKDGTRIAYERSGEGTPLVLVHGASSDHTTTRPFVLPTLEKRFTLCAVGPPRTKGER